MKIKIITVLIVLAVLASGITACTPKGGDLLKVMKLAPRDADMVSCMDIKAMAEDPDFSFIYDDTISNLSYELFDDMDIDVSAISTYAVVETDGDSILVFIGEFDLEDIRDALMEEDFAEDEYRGVEIWTNDYENAVAFIDNMIVFSYSSDIVEACIRRHKNEGSSMYDNEDMKSVADKLPAAIFQVVFGSDSYIYEFEYLSGSICLSNEHPDDETLDISGWVRFDSAASAEATMEEDFEDDVRMELDATYIDARPSGQFIEITGEMEIPE